ncbi:hypothetical protein [Paludibaculum fermentans]|uniref:hypothetical protein n=1 Tax=Paludibaculum fermentans TaxID=1473598 RepID=UPI003EB862E3
MTHRIVARALLLLLAGVASAREPKLYKLKFREGAANCAVVPIPEDWQYSPEQWPRPLSPGRWELRKDATAPEPGYLLRWNGEDGSVPANYSQSVFRLEWTGDKPAFLPVARQRWAGASRMSATWWGNTRAPSFSGDDPKVVIEGRSFERTGKHWIGTPGDAILAPDKRWLVLQSSDGGIVRRTLFGEGPDRPLAGRVHIDVYHVPTGRRTIQLEIDQTGGQGLITFLADTSIYEGRYLFLRVDPRPQQVHYLVCKLPPEP